MYSNPLAAFLVLAFWAIGIVAQIHPGTYMMINVRANATARAYSRGDSIFVAHTRENPGPFQYWDFIPANHGGFAIQNVGLASFGPAFAAAEPQEPHAALRTSDDPVPFRVTPAGNGEFHIGVMNRDLLWTVARNGVRVDVTLNPANGDAGQRWVLRNVPRN